MSEVKTALVFPGLGYHPDKPLLYHGKKLAASLGYEVIEIRYGGFAWGVKDNPDKMREAFESALRQTEDILLEKGFYSSSRPKGELLFLSKSIGTAAAAAWQKKHGLSGRHIYYTPVAETFLFTEMGSGIAFHGTADSWVDTDLVKEKCNRFSIPLFITENADHSMETGDVLYDLDTLKGIMEECRRYISRVSCQTSDRKE